MKVEQVAGGERTAAAIWDLKAIAKKWRNVPKDELGEFVHCFCCPAISLITVVEFYSVAYEIQYIFVSKWASSKDFLICCKTTWGRAIENRAEFFKLSFFEYLNINKIEDDINEICSPNLMF